MIVIIITAKKLEERRELEYSVIKMEIIIRLKKNKMFVRNRTSLCKN
jgi:hypothetical protein